MPDPKKSGIESPTFCVMPFFNLATETNGKCKICCVVMTNKYIKDQNGRDFLIQEDSLEEIWNSEYLRNVRSKLLLGEKVADCFYCYKMEEAGSSSPRQQYNERWLESAVKEVERSALNGFFAEAPPQSIEPRPGILCNLKCVMCWSMSSSKVFSERQAALAQPEGEVPSFLQDAWKYEVKEARESNFAWAESERYLDNLRKTLPRLKRLYVTGGEPALIKSNRKILEELLALGRKDCLVSFTTNLSVDSTELLELASEFDRIEITGSLDAYGPLNTYIRYPSNWTTVEKNIELILSKPAKFSFAIMSVIQVLNLYGFPEFLKWLSENRELRGTHIIPTIIQQPLYLRPETAPAEMRRTALGRYDELLASPQVGQHSRAAMLEIVKFLDPEIPASVEQQRKLASFLQYNDKIRKTSINSVFPELAESLRQYASL